MRFMREWTFSVPPPHPTLTLKRRHTQPPRASCICQTGTFRASLPIPASPSLDCALSLRNPSGHHPGIKGVVVIYLPIESFQRPTGYSLFLWQEGSIFHNIYLLRLGWSIIAATNLNGRRWDLSAFPLPRRGGSQGTCWQSLTWKLEQPSWKQSCLGAGGRCTESWAMSGLGHWFLDTPLLPSASSLPAQRCRWKERGCSG